MQKANYEVLQALLDRKGIRASDLCKATGIHSSTISRWKGGEYSPKQDKVQTIADFFGVAPWIFYDVAANVDSYFKKPVYDVAAGQGRYNGPFADEYVDADADDGFSYVRVHGDSMYPILMDGDMVKVHHQPKTEPSDFTVVKVDGEHCTIKYIEIVNNGVWLRAENKSVYEDRFFSVEDVITLPVTIIGKAVEVRREL